MRRFWQLMVFCTIALWADSALAQRRPIADDTLGSERSVVTPEGNLGDRISGGARRGDNLFHSFREFGVDVGRSVYFDDPGVRNILSRVTGGNPSEIFGTLGVRGGNANLFLINPSGIVFGAGASLDVNGSFVGTTANAIQFGNQGFFSASEPNAPPLLTVQPSAFLFNQVTAQPVNSIENRGVLRVPENESLLLIGGNISPTATATGRILIDGGFLRVPDGRIELAGVSAPGVVGLDIVDSQLRLQFPNSIARSNIALTNGANVNTSGNSGGSIQVYGRAITIGRASGIQSNTLGTGAGGGMNVNASELVQLSDTTQNGISGLSTQLEGTGTAGDITIQTRRLLIQGGAQVSTGVFGATGAGGNLNVIATDSIEITDVLNNGFPSGLFTEAVEGSSGNSGNLMIQTRQLRLLNGAEISSANFSNGSGGDISLMATDSVEVSGFRGRFFSNLGTSAFGEGNAGDLTIQTGQLMIQNGGVIAASAFGGGTGGTLRIDTRQLLMQNGAGLGATTRGQGEGGDLFINASDSVQIGGGRSLSILTVSSESRENTGGNAGDLSISTGRLLLQGRAQVTAATLGGGEGGNLRVVASDSVQLSGTPAVRGTPSGLFASTKGIGGAGDLFINTGQLQVQDGATISVDSAGSSRAGNLRINTRTLSLNNRANITAANQSGSGGNIELQISDTLRLRNNSVISASTETGQAGNLQIEADSIQIGDRGGLFVESTQGGTAGSLTIDTERLTARDQAQVSVNSTGLGQAGDLNVTAHDIFLDDRARLQADTESGNGANINLSVSDILRLLNDSRISATTDNGQGGQFRLNADRNPTHLVELGNSRISTAATGTGNAGNLAINTGELRLQERSDISASTQSGRGGGITLRGLDALQVNNSTISASTSTGNAGRLQINAETIDLSNQGRLVVEATGQNGEAGDLTVTADEVTLSDRARLSANTENSRSGNVRLQISDSLSLTNDSEISASTQSGRGGSVILSGLESLQLSDSRISASAHTGRAGNVRISARGSTQLQDGSQLSVETRRLGTAGNLQLTTGQLSVDRSQITVSNPNGKAGSLAITADSVQLNRGRLRADIGGNATGADIDLQLGGTGLQMQNGSRVSAVAADNARGGNVTVNALNGLVVASPEDNDIRASASQGRGGDIQINAQGIFGLEERRSIAGNGTSDIDASSDFGTAGTVAINRLDPDPAQGLIELPIAPIDASNQIARNCPISGDIAGEIGEFVITGRGGVPSNPAEILGGETILTDLAEIEGEGQGNHRTQEQTADRTAVSPTAKAEIIEAQGWVMGADGKVRLTTDNPTVEPHRPPIAPVSCPSS